MGFLKGASTTAGTVDAVFLFILALSTAFLVGITAVMIYFVIRYNRKRHPKGKDIEGNVWLETAWTVTPTVLFLVMFAYGWTNYGYLRAVPRDAMVITVTARQWAWSFTYPNGRRTDELVIALGKPVKLELESLDVIHGFFVPAFRIKEDVVPGKRNYTWFEPTQLGSFDIQCTVICGVHHAQMLSKVIVVPVSAFEAWYFGDASAPVPGTPAPAPAAAAVAVHPAVGILKQKQCLACHSLDGSPMVGPTFKGLYGRKEILVSGSREREIAVDEARLATAIRNPLDGIVKGHPPVMPTIPMSDVELEQVVDFIKTLR